jgi:hypothetical protein
MAVGAGLDPIPDVIAKILEVLPRSTEKNRAVV